MSTNLNGKTIFITGATRGIGREIALRAARDGANVVITGKTVKPHATLLGTIYTVAEEVEKAGGKALPVLLDVREETLVVEAINQAAQHFGGIDVLVNNASAIYLANTLDLPMRRFDLMMGVNVRATYMCSKYCIPHLKKSRNPHILTLSPPLNMDSKWFKNHVAYTMSKYGMSMCTLGMSAEFKSAGIAVNSLWPKTTIATAAIAVHFSKEMYEASRTPAIVADAAHEILTSNSREVTGQFFIDEDFLRTRGVTDFSRYAVTPNITLTPDLFL